jgi:hypothetical protein
MKSIIVFFCTFLAVMFFKPLLLPSIYVAYAVVVSNSIKTLPGITFEFISIALLI